MPKPGNQNKQLASYKLCRLYLPLIIYSLHRKTTQQTILNLVFLKTSVITYPTLHMLERCLTEGSGPEPSSK